MNTNISSRDIEQRLASERIAVQNGLAQEEQLVLQRVSALETGTDQDVDAIEKQLSLTQQTIDRGNERVALLENRLAQAREQERNAEFDQIAAKADEARLEGEKLIRDYAKAAKTLAAVLKRLATTDQLIEAHNRVLAKGGRTPVQSSNAIRCTPSTRIERVVSKTVGGNEPGHPEFKFCESGFGGRGWINSKTKRPIEPVEIQVSKTDLIEGHFPEPLYQAIVLPAAEAMEIVQSTSGQPEALVPEPIYANA